MAAAAILFLSFVTTIVIPIFSFKHQMLHGKPTMYLEEIVCIQATTSFLPNGRASKVSYNRPFVTRSGGGAGGPQDWLFNAEYPMIRFLERNGYDVTYTTNVDAARSGALIKNHKVFLSVGHDEYWSKEQRDNVEAARDAGVHLAFFSGNSIYWKTRWENSADATGKPDPLGDPYRTLVCYKEGTLGDGTTGEAACGNKCDPDPIAANIWTGLWRTGGAYDAGQPENALSGQISWNGTDGAIQVPAIYKNLRFWRNTSIASLGTGQTATFPYGTLGYEWDFEQYPASYPSGRITMSSTIQDGRTHKLSLYRHQPGNALVFGAGTVQWSWGLDANHDRGNAPADIRMQQATINLFADMGVQPESLMEGLIAASASEDFDAPQSIINSPAHNSNATTGTPLTISGTSTDNGGGVVAGIEISTDGGTTWQPVTGTTNWTYSWVPVVTGPADIRVRGFDDSGNMEIPGANGTANHITITVAAATTNLTIFQPTDVPATQGNNDGTALELGVKFQSTQNGFITGIRFYKGTGTTGTHIGNLWSRTGTLLASATFTNETASGWQQVLFSDPVFINANTTYVASYFSSSGDYADTNPYFIQDAINGPLRALANGTDGPNGVYKYSAVSAFPIDTYNSSNYWVDVLFNISSSGDVTLPTVVSVSPSNGATGVSNSTSVIANFNEAIDASTVTGASFQLKDAANNSIAATISASSNQIILTPSSALAPSSTYTVTIKGGASGAKDLAGNELANDFSWTFTIADPPPPFVIDGYDGPILVVHSAANPFSRYAVEILRAEGLNGFLAKDILDVTPADLDNYDVVILGEMTIDDTQAAMFNTWTHAGGTLIAFRPSDKLSSLLGITKVAGSMADKYLLVNTSNGPGKGIVAETMQYHGTADLYSLNGATSIATLFTDAATPTTYPAITINTAGSGKAIAFTYDLAKSVVYTRQGNPDWAGQSRDGDELGRIRPDNLFFGTGGESHWVDFNKITIPQADEQQRLLANIIIQTNLAKKPLPRLWYMPKGYKAALVHALDDHATTSGTKSTFNKLLANSPAGCSVDDWECYRATSWFFMGTSLNNNEASVYNSQGFEMGAHVHNNCQNFTSFANLDANYIDQLQQFRAMYPSLQQQTTHRFHCIIWSDWLTQAKVELSHGIRYSLDYYYWPPGWVNGRPGLFTGSGMPMRFADTNGDLIDIYQGVSQLVNENGIDYALGVNTLLDNAIGSKGYYGFFGTHDDYTNPNFLDEIIASAKARNVPIISAQQMLTWLDGRNNTSFGPMTWNNHKLDFSMTVPAGARNLKTMLPRYSSATHKIISITRNGSIIDFEIQMIKGMEYAFFDGLTGNYVATYETVGPLPVTLLNLSAVPNENSITVRWSTATEINNQGFELQRSNDGNNWSAIAFVNGAGNSNSNKNYLYEDKNLLASKYYYRLKQVDIDQRFVYSPIVSARLDNNGNFSLEQNYPNPFRNETIVKFTLPRAEKVNLSLFDMNGRLVKVLVSGSKERGTHAINVNTASLSSGLYYYKIQAGNFSAVKKMTVQ